MRKKEKSLEELKNIKLLENCTKDELQAIQSVAHRVEFPEGAVIMKEGDVGDSMYLFAEGEVLVTKNLTLKTGKKGFSTAEKSMVRLNAQYVPFFGDMAMFENDVRSATITASSKCVLYNIKREDFEMLATENSSLSYRLIRRIATVLCHRVRQGNQDVLKLTTALSIALSK